ncbi:hypothetical protein OSB04_023380 [Centaurea solstitialis]|uniref:Ubiquitin thioesterase OTU n=1 Tax=Centaurea solstitialis TaxID=347529 RepID=A0AA38SJR8_9ASTR|nr:hypothetical protein OSB04_023380 [Centaurea solstitialis]
MIACSPIRTCVKSVVHPSGSRQSLMPSSACCFHLSLGCVKPSYVAKPNTHQSLIGSSSDIANQRSNLQLLTIKSAMRARRGTQKTRFDLSLGSRNMNFRLLFPKQGIISRMKWSLVPGSWMQGCASAGLVMGLTGCNSNSEPAHAEAKENKEDDGSSKITNFSHGKEVHTNYSVIGIPGDGRCLFRAVAHGACIRSGKPAPSESLQRELADELRARVADEFVKRREETEWFIEGDFDSYVSQIRKTHVWGGEPELLMASHVLKMPISVYMNDRDSGGLISIAEYGHEYSKEDPIRVLYHGFGHYDALHIPGKTDSRARL